MKKLTMFFFCMPVVVFCQWNQASPTKLTTTNAVDISGDLWVRNGAILSSNFTDTDPANTWNSNVLVRNGNATVGTFSRLSFLSESGGFGAIAVKKTGEFTGDMYLQVRNGPGFYQTPMFIGSNGRIGIGTLSPLVTLDVNGSIHTNQSLETDGDIASHGMIEIGRGGVQDTKLRFHNYSRGWYSMGLDASDGLFKINSGENIGDATQFVLHWNGNVGIGTTTPDQKLTVDGGIKCEEVKVEIFQGTGPDYVFDRDYSLLPLSEIEAYIKQNKHLPEVPSAKEMESNGLNLKEMNLLLLKKVEELTLHLIEQEKNARAQDEKIQTLQKKIDNLINNSKK